MPSKAPLNRASGSTSIGGIIQVLLDRPDVPDVSDRPRDDRDKTVSVPARPGGLERHPPGRDAATSDQSVTRRTVGRSLEMLSQAGLLHRREDVDVSGRRTDSPHEGAPLAQVPALLKSIHHLPESSATRPVRAGHTRGRGTRRSPEPTDDVQIASATARGGAPTGAVRSRCSCIASKISRDASP